MAKEFEGKVALVTGGSRGIGRAAVVRLAEGGCKIAIGYAGNDAAAAETKAAAEAAGAPALHLIKFDVADAAACASAFHLSKAAARPMLKSKGGAIVNLTSVVGEQGNAGQTAYAMAKAGLIGLTKSLARELGNRNVRVNAVSPGLIDTDMTRDLPEAAKKAMSDGTALGRAGTAREVAEAIAFLASDRAAYITGEVLRVNGGLYM
jgi:3-oxoacyl-[acyl-carrier protein] reductase